jgi:hypothetical protein
MLPFGNDGSFLSDGGGEVQLRPQQSTLQNSPSSLHNSSQLCKTAPRTLQQQPTMYVYILIYLYCRIEGFEHFDFGQK